MINDSDVSPTKLESVLKDWSDRWKFCDFTIECRMCGAVLRAKYANHAFPHTSGCPSNFAGLDYPWHELRRHLRQVQIAS